MIYCYYNYDIIEGGGGGAGEGEEFGTKSTFKKKDTVEVTFLWRVDFVGEKLVA